MKTLLLSIMALGALAACSKPDPIPEALKLLATDSFISANEALSEFNEYAYIDLDKDGTSEIVMRQHIVEEWGDGTGYIAFFTNGKSGLKLIGTSHNMAQTGSISFCADGTVHISDANEGGTWSESSYNVLKNSEVAVAYYDVFQYVEPNEDAEYDENWQYDRESFFVSDPAGSERKKISQDEFEKAIAGCSEGIETSSLNWQKIEVK